MTQTTLTLAERVAAGAAWLDDHKPGWDALIDLGRLNMADSCCCVLGQVYESAAEAANDQARQNHDDWGWTGYDWAIDELGAPQYYGGFAFTYDELIAAIDQHHSTVPAWAELGTAWKQLIAARRAGESR
jgi:hypothetical protein